MLPISDEPIDLGPVMLPPVQLVGAGVSSAFFAGFTWFFLKSRMGVAMRAVADNQQVAMAMGINVERYFALAWAMARHRLGARRRRVGCDAQRRQSSSRWSASRCSRW